MNHETQRPSTQPTAHIVETPGMSYGLFHAVAQPVLSWGVIRQVKFPGVNLDIGHLRHHTWSKDNDSQAWIAYNRLRGQHMSALEHAVPERFFTDPSQCNPVDTLTPQPQLPTCPQGISAVKAIALAAQQGQRIYTITPAIYAAHPTIVSTDLTAHSSDTQTRIQQALESGLEVTIHQAPITQSGWTGAGIIIIDPNTGAGGYLIEGGTNGGGLYLLATFIFAIVSLAFLYAFGPFAILGYGWMLLASLGAAIKYLNSVNATADINKVFDVIGAFLAIIGFAPLGITLIGYSLIFSQLIGLIFALRTVVIHFSTL